jgi:hypothetical protein
LSGGDDYMRALSQQCARDLLAKTQRATCHDCSFASELEIQRRLDVDLV